jgi:hypothetical protein
MDGYEWDHEANRHACRWWALLILVVTLGLWLLIAGAAYVILEIIL